MTDIMALLTFREVQEACPRTRPRSIYTKLAEVAAVVGRLFLVFSSFPHLEDAQHTWMHLEDAVNAENPQNRSFEGIITSQSNRPTQIFVTLAFASKSLHISTHQEFSTSFSFCQGVFISITTFFNPDEMIKNLQCACSAEVFYIKTSCFVPPGSARIGYSRGPN